MSPYGGYTTLDLKEGSEDREALVLDLGCDSGLEFEVEVDTKECELESPVSGKSAGSLNLGGFEVTGIVGGAPSKNIGTEVMKSKTAAGLYAKGPFRDDVGDRSSSDGEEDGAATAVLAEMKPLVKA